MLTKARIVQTAVRVGQRCVRQGGGQGARMRSQGRVVMRLRVNMRVLAPDVVPVSLQEAQLGVIEDVKVCSTQTMVCCPQKEVTVVLARLPPHWEVQGGTAELEAG